ncbi:hypothetical protein GmHk_01G001113 [Glycine max]|nr:hypothetical protein GmHk_01G001113 [Glycine max]
MSSTFNVGQELYVGMEFDSKDAVKNAVKQYVMKVHQSFKVVESKSNKYVVCCLNKSVECPCPFYMRAILSKKTDTWKVTQWGGPHTCLNMTMTQDHEKLDSDLIVTCVVDPSIKVSLIQERINSEFAYKVSYKKAWLAKQKAIAIEYGDWKESYAKLSSWLTHMQNHSPGSYFQILHDDFIIGNTVSREHRQFHRAFLDFWPIPLSLTKHLVDNLPTPTLLASTFFYQNLEKFRELSPAIATWIDRISKEKWTMAYDREGRRYGHMTTNLSECINKVLKDCRNIPITALVKSTYNRCRKYFVERGRQAQRQLNEGQVYCSKLVKELRKNQEQACSHIVRVYDIHSTRKVK